MVFTTGLFLHNKIIVFAVNLILFLTLELTLTMCLNLTGTKFNDFVYWQS